MQNLSSLAPIAVPASVAAATPADDLSALLAGLETPPSKKKTTAPKGKTPAPADPVVEVGLTPMPEVDSKTLEAVAASLEAAESAPAEAGPTTLSAVPTAVTEPTAAPVPVASEEGSEAPVPESAVPTPAAAAAASAPRRARGTADRTKRVHQLEKSMGEDLVQYSALTTSDVGSGTIDPEALRVRTLDIIRKMNVKKQGRATNLFEFLANKRGKLNGVIKTALDLVIQDGHVAMGMEGNLFKALLKRPYSEKSARAMGGNTISMLEDLMLVKRNESGLLVANDDSFLLQKAREMFKAGALVGSD